MNKTTIRRKQYPNQNTIETHRGIGGAIIGQIQDTAKGFASDAMSQFLGPLSGEKRTHQSAAGDLTEGQDLILTNINVTSKIEHPRALSIEPGIDYRRDLLHGYKKIAQENTKDLSKKIQDITIELKRIIVASEELRVEFKEVSIEQHLVAPGKYHLNFFEWVLSAIRLARMKIEDSGAWLSAYQNKKKKKQYWAMFKKHGTTFGLSNERVVATQTG